MANFTRGAALVLILVAFLSFLVFKNSEWIAPENDKGPTAVNIRKTATMSVKSGRDIRKFLKPPNPYRVFENAEKKYSQAQQDVTVYDILPIRNGFFIEMGAYNGHDLSNTLWFERKYNWTGLLIEANPDLCRAIENVKRMAWRLCACISNELDAMFVKGGGIGGVSNTLNDRIARNLKNRGKIKVPCFTLSEALGAIGVQQIDYFSLDVEGAELIILESIMTDLQTRRLTVKVWTIEYRIYDGSKNLIAESAVKLNQLRAFFKKVGGYSEFLQLGSKNKTDGHSLDVVFMKSDLYDEYCKRNQSRPFGNTCKTQ